ncbi:ABC transporter ATP-binding protein [Bradyrhizobium sp. HKCCYLR20261]|uniref:ABC transporter ATP-binding protein n=1 Tax=Bradyrhizobium sp. HKCCYLR20261 TaxID=3420760 RepID=UPI003EBC8B6F
MSSLKLRELACSFNGVTAVETVTLDIAQGEFVTLLGPSGCGKTTTLRMVAGLEQNSGGSIAIGETVVSDPVNGVFVQPDRRNIGMVFQSYAIWPHMSVFDNVAYPARVAGQSRDEIVRRVDHALGLVSMQRYASRPATALSGGQQQRVAIARAIATKPSILLMDEPLSNLDAKLREQMRIELRQLQKTLGITTLYVTHDQEEAMALSDRVVVMSSGRILQVGRPTDVYRRPDNREVAEFFGSPSFLRGMVREARDGAAGQRWVVGNGWSCQTQSNGMPQVGDEVDVLMRPENFAVGPTDDEAALQLRGVVRQSVYKGARYQVGVAFGGASVIAELPQDHAWTIGDEIQLHVPGSRLWCMNVKE